MFGRRVTSGVVVQQVQNLHDLKIKADGASEPLSDYGVCLPEAGVEVVFRHLGNRVISMIQEAEFVVGCVAWMTNRSILAALAERRGVSIIVQKEDFLRPDVSASRGWRADLRSAYERLPGLSRFGMPEPLSGMSVATDPTIDPVRCVGNHNSSKVAAFPRAHNKFLVFCRAAPRGSDEWYDILEGYAVWTGSFNLTESSGRSFENAVILRQPEVVKAYLHEFAQIAALSEPLDWESPWAEPEWRIGT